METDFFKNKEANAIILFSLKLPLTQKNMPKIKGLNINEYKIIFKTSLLCPPNSYFCVYNM